MDFKKIEQKWQKKWKDSKIDESNIEDTKKFFINIPYPYVNGAPHIGHSYTYVRTDAMARFKRLMGFNVLYPQGFHATGEPIVGVMKRLKEGDENQISILKSFGVSDSDLENFKKSPENLVNFWIKRWKEIFVKTGFSIDWRRDFVTTQMTPQYSRFIEWQYNTLKKNGYVVKGTHPVIWCPKDQSPTGDHDRLEGEGETINEYIIVKFKSRDFILPAATLRPETIFGVTNIWVNSDAVYLKAEVNGEKWIFCEDVKEKLMDQEKEIKVIEKIKGKDLLEMKAEHPITKEEIPIFESNFVKTNTGTGIVMSVPSHAPYDWIALKNHKEIKPIAIITVEGMEEHPAMQVCKQMNIESIDDKNLEKATKEVYKKEYHKGKLNDRCGKWKGIPVSKAKENMITELEEQKIIDFMWETTGKVVCRCTTPNHVKILKDQWFLKFSDKKWKDKVKAHLDDMKIIPKEAKNNFLKTIDWLENKACTRKSGLGTPLPWDKNSIVETLSDSTIYMIYYTLARIIKEEKINETKLTDSVFDYILLDKGNLDDVSKSSGLDSKIIKEMKNEFEYFYPVDLRISGKDLIQNHLTFFLFHHVALLSKKYFPKSISVNGFVSVEGEKMSKSKGNIIPMEKFLDQIGADMLRLNIASSSEGLEDADWRFENITMYKSRYSMLFDIASDTDDSEGNKMLDDMIEAELKTALDFYENMEFRKVTQHALINTTNMIKKYSQGNQGLKNILNKIIVIMYPLTPHICEEMWSMCGNEDFIIKNSKDMINEINKNYDESLQEKIKFFENIIEDIKEIKNIVKFEPKKATIFIANNWKFEMLKMIDEKKDKKEIMDKFLSKSDGKYIADFIQKFQNHSEIIDKETQKNILNEFSEMISKGTGLEIDVIDSDESDDIKSKTSTPEKLGILMS